MKIIYTKGKKKSTEDTEERKVTMLQSYMFIFSCISPLQNNHADLWVSSTAALWLCLRFCSNLSLGITVVQGIATEQSMHVLDVLLQNSWY